MYLHLSDFLTRARVPPPTMCGPGTSSLSFALGAGWKCRARSTVGICLVTPSLGGGVCGHLKAWQVLREDTWRAWGLVSKFAHACSLGRCPLRQRQSECHGSFLQEVVLHGSGVCPVTPEEPMVWWAGSNLACPLVTIVPVISTGHQINHCAMKHEPGWTIPVPCGRVCQGLQACLQDPGQLGLA